MTHSAPGRHSRAHDRASGPAGPVRIAVDLLGGDEAPAVVVDGALRACGVDPDLSLLLVGTRRDTDEALGVLRGACATLDVLVVERGVRMSDPVAHGADPRTSIGAAVRALANAQVDAVVSAGASGATVAAAVLALGRVSGVRRPALAAILPTGLVLLDVGAGMQVKPADLAQHAALGCDYARQAAGVAQPRVGLLSVGSEPGKGDWLRRAADAVLRLHPLPGAGYVGPVEGHDVITAARADVVVTDGFTGNVLLKGIEAVLAALPASAITIPRAAALLGVTGTVVVCHGAADSADIASGVALAASLVRGEAVVRPAEAGRHPAAHQDLAHQDLAHQDLAHQDLAPQDSGDHRPPRLAEVHP